MSRDDNALPHNFRAKLSPFVCRPLSYVIARHPGFVSHVVRSMYVNSLSRFVIGRENVLRLENSDLHIWLLSVGYICVATNYMVIYVDIRKYRHFCGRKDLLVKRFYRHFADIRRYGERRVYMHVHMYICVCRYICDECVGGLVVAAAPVNEVVGE